MIPVPAEAVRNIRSAVDAINRIFTIGEVPSIKYFDTFSEISDDSIKKQLQIANDCLRV